MSSGAVPPASGRGTGSMAAMRGGGMDIQPHCAGEHGRAAAASGAPLEPIHDLLMSETQLRSSPSGTGRSLLGLEKDVVGAPAPRRGGGDVPGGQGREMGQLGGWGAEPPSRCTESAWKGSRQQLQGWRGVSGRPVPRSPRCPPLAHWLQWGAPQGQGHLLLWGAGAEASRLITKER